MLVFLLTSIECECKRARVWWPRYLQTFCFLGQKCEKHGRKQVLYMVVLTYFLPEVMHTKGLDSRAAPAPTRVT